MDNVLSAGMARSIIDMCAVEKRVAALELAVAKFTSTNSDYATALRVKEEYLRTATPEQFGRGFMSWCEQRLNAEVPHSA